MSSIFVCTTLWAVIHGKSVHCVTTVEAFAGTVNLNFGDADDVVLLYCAPRKN
jgi:hypothetical protein